MESSRPPSYTSRTEGSHWPDNEGLLQRRTVSPLPQMRSYQLNRWRLFAFTPHLHKCRHWLRALTAALASTFWITMIIYFFVYYTTVLDKNSTGNFPRIGPSYSVWPYISCIGAVRERFFQFFAITTAMMLMLAFALDAWLGRNIKPGRKFRMLKFIFASLSGCFLIALSFESVNSGNHLHLIFTSFQIIFMGAAKLMDNLLNWRMWRVDRTNPYLRTSKIFKRSAGVLATIASPVAVIGIYGCQSPVGLLPHTATCWKLVAWAAPMEWILAISFAMYLLTVSYDLFRIERVRESVIAKSNVTVGEDLRLARVRKVSNLERDAERIIRPSQGHFSGPTGYTAVKDQMMSEDDEGFGGSAWERRTREYI